MTARWIRCPNCGDRIEKDAVTLHLESGTRFADPESGRQMSKSGGYKETLFCGLCRGPIKTKALLAGSFDEIDLSIFHLAAWALLSAFLFVAGGWPWWAAGLAPVPLLALAEAALRALARRNRRAANSLERRDF